MKNFLKNIFKFLLTIFIGFIIYIFLFSFKSNLSIQSTISYLKTAISQIFDVNSSTSDYGIILTSANNHYYYEQLDDIGKIIYSALENNIDNLKKENYTIDFSTTFNDLLHTTSGQYKLNRAFQSALDAFFYDHPELFYIDLTQFSINTKCISILSLKTYTVEITPQNQNYLQKSFKTEQELNNSINQLENIKNTIINNITSNNTYEQIKQVHDILVNTLEYDTSITNTNKHNIYGALIEKQAVCEGYAKAFKYIMDNIDVECILVSGTALNSSRNNEAHMWNYVRLNDNWYGVDVTWDDPIIIGSTVKNNLRHDYFLKGRRTFDSSHIANGKISNTGMLFTIPSLSDNDYK